MPVHRLGRRCAWTRAQAGRAVAALGHDLALAPLVSRSIITQVCLAPMAGYHGSAHGGDGAGLPVLQLARSPVAETWKAPSTQMSRWPPRIMAKLSAGGNSCRRAAGSRAAVPALVRSVIFGAGCRAGPMPRMPFSLCSNTISRPADGWPPGGWFAQIHIGTPRHEYPGLRSRPVRPLLLIVTLVSLLLLDLMGSRLPFLKPPASRLLRSIFTTCSHRCPCVSAGFGVVFVRVSTISCTAATVNLAAGLLRGREVARRHAVGQDCPSGRLFCLDQGHIAMDWGKFQHIVLAVDLARFLCLCRVRCRRAVEGRSAYA